MGSTRTNIEYSGRAEYGALYLVQPGSLPHLLDGAPRPITGVKKTGT
jgi:hypothetical protein